VLLQADDISARSGLGEESLSSLLAPVRLFGEAPTEPSVVGAEAGFGS
jgi:hypothetical protein